MPKEYSTPGPRAVYPEMCASRSLGACGLVANVLWPRLISIADDQGRIAGDATDVLSVALANMRRRVKHRDVEIALEELARAHQIRLYEVADEPYIQIVSWWSWQHGQRRAYPSRHPAPPGWDDYVYGYGDHPATFREAGGFPQRARKLPTEPGAVADVGGTSQPQPPPSGTASVAGVAVTVEPPEPQVQAFGTATGTPDAGAAQCSAGTVGTTPGRNPRSSGGDLDSGGPSDIGHPASGGEVPESGSQARVAVTDPPSQPHGNRNSLAQPRVPRARPVPGPAGPGRAVAESHVDDSKLKPVGAVSGRNDPSETDEGTSGPRLTAEQLDAWRTYERVQWAPFKAAWLARGFPWPPGGDPSDDPGDSVRGRLWAIAQDDPSGLGRLVGQAPAGSSPHRVVGFVFERWNAARSEASVEDPEWELAKAEDRRTAGRVMTGIGAVLAGVTSGDDFDRLGDPTGPVGA